MTMHRGDGTWLALHDLQVHEDFTGAFLRAGQLIAFEIYQAHVLRLHEAFGHQCWRAEGQVFTDANGDIPSVTIHVRALPKASANIAELQFQFMELRRIEQ